MNQIKLTPTEIKYLRILSKRHILLPTKFKKPLVDGWNKYYAEHRSIERLLELNQEYSLRTGTPIGSNYYFIAIDLDDLWAKERIKTNWMVETDRGIHRYFFIKELPKSCWLVNQNGDRIGELHSKGRFVVGIGSIHKSGKRYSLKGKVNQKWKTMIGSLKELQEFLKERGILTIPWGKKGLENVRDLELYEPKTVKKLSTKSKKKTIKPVKILNSPKSQSLNSAQKYYQKKEKLEKWVNNYPKKENLNTCYICLVIFPKQPKAIKLHLNGKKHQKKWKIYQAKKTKQTTP